MDKLPQNNQQNKQNKFYKYRALFLGILCVVLAFILAIFIVSPIVRGINDMINPPTILDQEDNINIVDENSNGDSINYDIDSEIQNA